MPGLKFNRDKIYAKLREEFKDGQNPTIKILTASELDKFKQILLDKLKIKALENMKQKVRDSNIDTGA